MEHGKINIDNAKYWRMPVHFIRDALKKLFKKEYG